MIEFILPNDDKLIKDMVQVSIEIRLYIWGLTHNVIFTSDVFDDKITVEFFDEKYYSLFALTWESNTDRWAPPKIL